MILSGSVASASPSQLGIHENDLAWALDDECALPPDVGRATISVLAAAFPLFAQAAVKKPDGAIGPSTEFRLRYRDGAWHQGEELPPPSCEISGDDSSVLLFALGRIPFDHPGLIIPGEQLMAGDFQAFLPGP